MHILFPTHIFTAVHYIWEIYYIFFMWITLSDVHISIYVFVLGK
jgi:hypothetical protein